MIRIALALLILMGIVLLIRNLYGVVRDTETARMKAWDSPILESGVAVLSAPPRAWAWCGGLAFLAALSNLVLIDRWLAGNTLSETWLHILLTAGLCVVAVRRAVQLSEKVYLTPDRIAARGWWGESWSMPLSDLKAVGETSRTAILDFGGGRTLEIPDWLEGRFWLARQLRRDVLHGEGEPFHSP